MRKLSVLFTAAFAASAFAGTIIPITPGAPGVVYQPDTNPQVLTEGGEDFVRFTNLSEPGGWPGVDMFFSPMINLTNALGAPLDASAPGSTLEFDFRYSQVGDGMDSEENIIPAYDDANAALELQIFSSWENTGRVWYGFGPIVTATESASTAGGTWLHVVVDLAPAAGAGVPLNDLNELEFFGDNMRYVSSDYVDMKNLVITPEPASLGLLGLALLGIARRR